MELLRAAILGCGQFAHQHAKTLLSLQDKIRLVAFCDHKIKTATEFSSLYTDSSAASYSHHQDLFENESIDLIIICLPPFRHTNEVELAAERGIHIFIEKPISLSSKAAWRMVEVTEKSNVKTQVGFKFRFGEAVEKFKKEIESGAAGPIALMSARYFCNSLHAPWWREKLKSGGQLVEQVIHMFDLLRYFGGEPENIISTQRNLFHTEIDNYTIEDVSASTIEFRNGGIGVIYATNNAIPGKWINDFRVVSKNMTAEFLNSNQADLIYTNQNPVETIKINGNNDLLKLQMIDLINAIQKNKSTRTPMIEGAKSLDLVLGANNSSKERKWIKLS